MLEQKKYTFDEMEEKFEKLSKNKKIEVLRQALDICHSYNGKDMVIDYVFEAMGYFKDDYKDLYIKEY